MKSKVDKLDANKLITVPTDLSKLSDRVRNEVIKKYMYDELVQKINAMILANLLRSLILNTKYLKISNLATATDFTAMPDFSKLVIKIDYDEQISEIETNISLLLIIISI